MNSEIWYKIWCEKCNTPNWVCDNNPTDMSGTDIEAIQCWKCNHSWWMFDDPDWLAMQYPEGTTPEDHAIKGMGNPE